MSRAKCLSACLVAGATLALPASSSAQNAGGGAAEAEALFTEGMALMSAGRYAEACPRLQQSQRLDPGMGTQYRLAECYQATGLIGSAWAMFTEVGEAARTAGRPDRAEQARRSADAIARRVPWMILSVHATTAGLPELQVKRDGEPVGQSEWNRRMPVDPGAHTVVVTAPKKKTWELTVRALEGGTVEVSVPLLEAEAEAAAQTAAPSLPAPGPPAPVASRPPDSSRPADGSERVAASKGDAAQSAPRAGGVPPWVWIVGGAGVAFTAAGVGFLVDQQSTQGRIDASCPDGRACAPGFDATAANDRLYRDFGLFVGFGAAGVLAMSAAVVGFATSPPASKGVSGRVTPWLGSNTAGVQWKGGF